MSRLVGGLAARLGATLVMEYASQWMYERQNAATRQREERLRTEMPTTTLVRKTGRLAGHELSEATAERLGAITHYAFGASGGPLAVALLDRGIAPVKSGLLVGAAMEIGADQSLNTVLGLTPPPRAFPLVTQVRAVLAHGVYGAALGLMLAAGTPS